MKKDLLKISNKILLGSGKFGGVLPEEQSFRLMDLYRELGGTIIDTGHCYGMFPPNEGRQPRAERSIGKYLRRNGREKLLICTKGGYPDLDTGHSRLSRQALTIDLEASLMELGIDCVDIYYLHRDDPQIPVSEIMPVVDDFYRQGKLRAIGVSNWSPERVAEANAFARANGLVSFSYVQNLRNLGPYCAWPMNDPTMRVTSEADIEKFHRMEDVQFVAYSAQAYGFFSKASPQDEGAARKLLAERFPYFDPQRALNRLRCVHELARSHGVTPAAVVLAYVLSDVDAPAAIIGCTQEAQLKEAMEGSVLRLTAGELEELKDA